MAALDKQLETLQQIVPEDKETDEFMRLLEGAAAASGVQVRKLTALNVVSRDYHYDMPFTIQVDGPYYDIVDFFARLSRLSRIINVGDLKLTGVPSGGLNKVHVVPGTSVTGTFTVTTFFTNSAEANTPPATARGRR